MGTTAPAAADLTSRPPKSATPRGTSVSAPSSWGRTAVARRGGGPRMPSASASPPSSSSSACRWCRPTRRWRSTSPSSSPPLPPASVADHRIWFAGSVGVTVALVLIGLLVPRLTAVRQMGVAGLASLLVCLLLDALLGPAADVRRSPTSPASIRASPSSSSPSPPPWRWPGSLPEPPAAPGGGRRHCTGRPLRGGRRLRAAARRDRRGRRRLGHGGRLPPAGRANGLPSAEEVTAAIRELQV